MNQQALLEDWARRAAEELKDYVCLAESGGNDALDASVLLREFDDIVNDRPSWKARLTFRASGDDVNVLDSL